MSKVFIAQLPTRFDKATNTRVPSIDVNAAARYGDLVTLFGVDDSREHALARMKSASRAIGKSDYILAVGDVVLLAMAIVYCLQQHGRANVLRWDNDAKKYRTEGVEK